MADSRRSTEKEEFWRLALGEHQQSGLTIRAFCQREGLSEPSFFAWRKKIQNLKLTNGPAQTVSEVGKLVPVEIIDSPVNDPLEIVTPGGFTLRCAPSVEPSRLGELIGVIVQCEQGRASC